ncbi:tryptophanase [Streptomyces chryseus]
MRILTATIEENIMNPEPYRIKAVEWVNLPTRSERARILKEANYSMAHLEAQDVYVDLVTDSGTGAMSDQQWAGIMRGDESYIRSRNFANLEQTVQEITGYKYVIPTHQGRAAENIATRLLIRPGEVVISNTHFDTTRAHVADKGGIPLDLVGDWIWDFSDQRPFKGDFDLTKVEIALKKYQGNIAFIVITVLNNFAFSSPVSMANIRAVRELADVHGVKVFFDACRFAENAFFIQQREPGYSQMSVQEIAQEMFSYGDGCWMSGKKDAIVNVGGFLAVNDEELTSRAKRQLVLYEGFPTYGGLAGRDLEAMAIGLREGMREDYLAHRTGQVAYLAERISDSGVGVSLPAGGSGVFVDVSSIYPHISAEALPVVTFCADMYLESGVRVGGIPMPTQTIDTHSGEVVERVFQFSRLAIPRRVYTKDHLDYVAAAVVKVKENANYSKGYRVTHKPGILDHFFAEFEPLA